MQPHLGGVVWCLANTAWLGSKFFRTFTLLGVKVYNLCRVKANRLVVLTVKSGLDPHMTKLWNLKVKSLFYPYLWCIYFINCGWYELTLFCNYVANKTWLTKMLNCLNLSHPPYGLACYVVFPLLSMARAHACLFSCIYNTRIAAQTGRALKTTPVISRSSRCACLQSAACGGILSAARTRYLCFV
jgi:hypothetical protein